MTLLQLESSKKEVERMNTTIEQLRAEISSLRKELEKVNHEVLTTVPLQHCKYGIYCMYCTCIGSTSFPNEAVPALLRKNYC